MMMTFLRTVIRFPVSDTAVVVLKHSPSSGLVQARCVKTRKLSHNISTRTCVFVYVCVCVCAELIHFSFKTVWVAMQATLVVVILIYRMCVYVSVKMNQLQRAHKKQKVLILSNGLHHTNSQKLWIIKLHHEKQVGSPNATIKNHTLKMTSKFTHIL